MAVKRVSEKEKKEDLASKNPIGVRDCIIKVMKDRPKGSNEFYINLDFNKDRKRFYSNISELNKDYGYTKNVELLQVELGECPF